MTTFDDLQITLTAAAASPEQFGGEATAPGRVAENGFVIEALLDRPRPSRLARLLRRLGMNDLTIPLVTATPALRRGWLAAVGVASLFALSAANASEATGAGRLQVFLALAPLVPLLGVALAFGPKVDPAHETIVAAPVDGFRVFVIRAVSVLTASIAFLLVLSLLMPERGPERVAWLLPALAVTAAASAVATRFDPRIAAAAVAGAWIAFVVLATSVSDAATTFGAATQWLAIAVTVLGAAVVFARRRRFDLLTEPSL